MFSNTRVYILFILGLFVLEGFAQDIVQKKETDSLYREDQFYFGVTYNIVTSVPNGVNKLGISGGLQVGYLRDMPINKRRNIAIGLGAGLSIDQYGQNLLIARNPSGDTSFSIIDDTNEISYNRLNTFVVEAPLEFRWRSSTPESYKFWRIHSGIRIGYVFHHKASFKESGVKITSKDIPELEKLRLGATLGLGYSTFNFYVYYSINPMFVDHTLADTGEKVDFRPIKLGLILYIL